MTNITLVKCTNKPLPFNDEALPINLLNVAGSLCERGFKINICDARKEKFVPKKDTLLIGIEVSTGESLKQGIEISKLAHEKGIPTVWMGIHPSVLPEETKRSKHVDHVIVGDADQALTELSIKLESKQKVQKIWNEPIKNLDTLPFVPFKLIDLKQYGGGAGLPILTSRGCPHNCGFCTNYAINKGSWRFMSAQRIQEHVEYYKQHLKTRDFKLFDDNFCADINRVVQVSKKLINEDIDWSASCRVDYVEQMNSGLLNLMKRSGCWSLAFGFESGSQRILNLVNKHVSVQQIRDCIKKLAENDFGFGGTFIYGLPGEAEDDIISTLKLIDYLTKTAPLATFESYYYIPCPGTALFETALEHGFDKSLTLEGWAGRDFLEKPWMSESHKRLVDRVIFISKLIGRPQDKQFTMLQRMTRNNISLLINNIKRGM